MREKLITFFLFIIFVIMLIPAVKGQTGNPIYYQSQTERNTKVGGPFESSGNNSRYALTEAIVEDKTFFFNEERAKFSAPDIVYFNGKYFSVFTPGVSFLGIPFYILGKSVGFPQLFTFLSTSLLALINTFLVISLARRFNIGFFTSIVTGFIFLFATNAFPYALTFVQHHATVTLILLALLNVLSKRTLLNNVLLGSIFAAGVLIDIPNLFLLSPIMLYAFIKHLRAEKSMQKLKLSFKLNMIGLIIGMLPFFALLGWYNSSLTGSVTTLPQSIGRTDYPARQTTESNTDQQQTSGSLRLLDLPFNPRKQLTGLNVLLFNNERGIFFYSPVLLIGILGFFIGYKSRDEKTKTLVILFSAVAAMNIILYSMFHDPWGGWSFGARYLIPSTAILAVATGLAIKRFKRNPFFIPVLIVLFTYSLGVNTIGAMTTTQVPPKGETLNLVTPIPYTYKYNWQLINQNLTGSLFYNLFLSGKIPVKTFVIIFYLAALSLGILIYLAAFLEKDKRLQND